MDKKFPCKHRLQTFLRNEKIPYETYKDGLRIGHVSISFRPEEDKVIFRDNRASHISYTTYYAHHLALLKKYVRFIEMIDAVIPPYLK